MNFLSTKIKGISIVEIIVSAAIIGISIVGIAGAIQLYLKIVHQNSRETQAVMYLDETSEALQYLRDVSFSTHFENVNPDTDYTIFWNGTGYEMSTSTITLQYDMARTIRFSDVDRGGFDQIEIGDGTDDPKTKKALVTISWPYAQENKFVSGELLIHDLYDN